jgi:hypothetical protein
MVNTDWLIASGSVCMTYDACIHIDVSLIAEMDDNNADC